jgi:hypothetical protein
MEFCAPQRMAVSANSRQGALQQNNPYSINLSAIDTSVGGTVMPNILAV